MAFRDRLVDQDTVPILKDRERGCDDEQRQDEDDDEETARAHGPQRLGEGLQPGKRPGLSRVGAAAIRAAMSVTSQQVRHIAKLARIAMSDDELERLVPELNNILGWVEQLSEVNTDGVEPLTAVIDQELRLRDDEVNDGNIRDEVLVNAPEAQHGFFAVPKVIE